MSGCDRWLSFMGKIAGGGKLRSHLSCFRHVRSGVLRGVLIASNANRLY